MWNTLSNYIPDIKISEFIIKKEKEIKELFQKQNQEEIKLVESK